MSEYILLYRGADRPTTPELIQETMHEWMEWFKGLAAQGVLVEKGQPLHPQGKVVHPGSKTIVDGPFAEAKDLVGGFSIVSANDLAEAATIAQGCPILNVGGTVEVRPVMEIG